MPNEAVQVPPDCTFLQQRSASFKAEHTTSQGPSSAIGHQGDYRTGTGAAGRGPGFRSGSGTPARLGSERPVKCGRTPTCWWGSSTVNGVPAVTYSPTPSRVQYHRRCGS